MKKITFKKLISIVLTVALITTSIPPRAAEASWFSDFCGGFFTILTAPIWVFCPDNPTFRKNNSFRKKAWQEEEERDKQREEVQAELRRIRITETEHQRHIKNLEEVIADLVNGQKTMASNSVDSSSITNEIGDLNARISDIQENVSSIKKTITTLDKRTDYLVEANIEYDITLSTHAAVINDWEDMFSLNGIVIETAVLKYNELSSKFLEIYSLIQSGKNDSSVNEENGKVKSNLRMLPMQTQTLEDIEAGWESKLFTQAEKDAIFNNKFSTLFSKIAELSNDLSNLNSRIDYAVSVSTANTKTIETLSNDLSNLNSRIDYAVSVSTANTKTIETLSNDLSNLNSRIDYAVSVSTANTKTIETLSNALSNLNSKIDYAVSVSTANTKTIETLRGDVLNISSQLSGVNKTAYINSLNNKRLYDWIDDLSNNSLVLANEIDGLKEALPNNNASHVPINVKTTLNTPETDRKDNGFIHGCVTIFKMFGEIGTLCGEIHLINLCIHYNTLPHKVIQIWVECAVFVIAVDFYNDLCAFLKYCFPYV